MQKNAKTLLVKAMSCEKNGYKLVAHQFYLMAIKELEGLFDEQVASRYQSNFDEIKEHSVKLGKLIKQRVARGGIIEQIYIDENSTGNSYNRLFGKYLDSSVQEMIIYETYLVVPHQVKNFINFLEVLLLNCTQLKFIHLVTKHERDQKNRTSSMTSLNPEEWLENIKHKLYLKYKISFTYTFEHKLHDRRILLGNGIKFKLHSGMDIYKRRDDLQFRPNDFDLKKCVENNIDIFHWESFA